MPVGFAGKRIAVVFGWGAILGTVILGVGGRVAMRMIAVNSGAPGAMSPSGTLTVVLAGAASGIAAALLHLGSRAVAARLAPGIPWLRHVLLGIALSLVTLRGLAPLDSVRLAMFTPLVLAFAVALEIAVVRRRVEHNTYSD